MTPFHYFIITTSDGQSQKCGHMHMFLYLTSSSENNEISYVVLIDANTLQITFSSEAN